MMSDLTVSVKLSDEAANACLNSIIPEIESDLHERTTVELRHDGQQLVLHITAKDLHAMRAAANTYIRWLDMCVKLTARP
jgi:tRNA threonylcarbamoyladenosine modification (KEOPS) complex  Pcc1 subunit